MILSMIPNVFGADGVVEEAVTRAAEAAKDIDFTDPASADRFTVENQASTEIREGQGLYMVATADYFDPIGANETDPVDVVKIPAEGESWTATVRFTFSGRWGSNSYFGVYAMDDYDNFVGVRASSNNMQDIIRKGGEVTANTMAKTPGLTSSTLHAIRIVKEGDKYTCYWSNNDFDFVELFSFEGTGIAGNTICLDAYSASAGGWFGSFSYLVEKVSFKPICEHESDPSLVYSTVTQEATCTVAGSKTTFCMRCGAFKTETIPALGHTKEGAEANVVAPTCTAQGYTEYVCPVCGETFVDDRVPATGHTKEGAEYVVTEPTCLEGGYTTYTCPVCGEEFVDDRTPALGHDWVDGDVIVEPGQDTFGKQEQKCSRCDATQEIILLPLEYKLGPTLVKDPESPTGYTAYFIYQNGDCQQAYFCGDIALKNDADLTDTKTYEPEEYKPGLMRSASITRRPMQKVGDDLWVTSVPLACGANQYWFNLDNNTSYMVPDPANHPKWSPNSNWDTKNAYNILYVPYDPVQDYETLKAREVECPREDQNGTWWYEPVEIDGRTHYMGVYLPYGYDAERAEPYKTIWILHGGGQDESDWMGIGSVQEILDNLIAEGRTEPAVLISPTTNNNMMGGTGDAYANLFEKLIPYVEEKFNVSTDKMDRCLGGLSMGSMNTQNIINADTDAEKFGYYGPWSGGVSVQATAKGIEYAHILFGGGYNDFGWGGASAESQVARMAEQGIYAKAKTVTGAHDFNTWCQLFRIWCEDYLWQPWAFGDGEAPAADEWKLADAPEDGGSYIIVADDQYALSGVPGEAGTTSVSVTIEDGKVVSDIADGLVVTFEAADGTASDGSDLYYIIDANGNYLRRVSRTNALQFVEYNPNNESYFVWSLIEREDGSNTFYQNGSSRYAVTIAEGGTSSARVSSSSGNILASGSPVKLYTNGKICEHEWTEVVTAPTCTEGGYTTKTCAKCGKVKITDKVPALGHTPDPETANTVAPTCTERGYTEYVCSVCGETYQTDFVNATGHSWGEWTRVTDPTCTEAGTEQRVCSVCEEVGTRSIAALGHDWTDGDILTEPTEEEFGVQELVCSRCGEKSSKYLLPTKYTAGPKLVADPESPTGYTGQFTYYDPNAEVVYFCGDLKLSDITESGNSAATYSPFEYRPGLMRRGGSQFKEPMTSIGNGWWYYEVPLAAGANQYWFNTNTITRMIPDPYNHPQWSPASNWNTKDAYNAIYVPYDEKQDNEMLRSRAKYENPRDDEKVGTWSYVQYDLPGQPGCYMGVYLPYGYDAEREKPYRSIYVLHGAGQDESDWLGIGSVQNIIDNLYAYGEIKEAPVLFVLRNSRVGAGNLEATFEFVEEKYNVSSDRMDRAICGLSMGGMMINNLLRDDASRDEPSFGYYGLFSGGQPSNALSSPHLLKSYYYVANGLYEGNIYNQSLVDSGAFCVFKQYPGAHDFNTWCQEFTDFSKNYAFQPWAFGDGEPPVELDTAALEAAIAEAEAIDTAPYTDESAAALAAALAAAKDALGADDQADIDAAAQALKDAIAALEEKPSEPIADPEKTYIIVANDQFALNKKEVAGLHSYANSAVTLGATPVTIEDGKVVSKVREGMLWTIKSAEDVPASYDGNDQYFIYAQDGSMLVRKNGRVNYAPMVLGTLDPENSYYATWSFTERENAEGAYTMYSNSDRSGQQPMAVLGAEKGFELNYAMWSSWKPQTMGSEIRLYEYDGVASPDVDTDALEAAIAAAEAIDPAPYTDETAEALAAALAAAKAAMDADSQDEIDAAAAALNEAIEGLVVKPDEPAEGVWKRASSIEPGKTYVIVADGQYALRNKEVPGLHTYTGTTVTLGSWPVTVEDGVITSQVTKNMLWTVQAAEDAAAAYDNAEQYYIYDKDGNALLRRGARSNYAPLYLGEVNPDAAYFATWSFYNRATGTRAVGDDAAYTMYSNSDRSAQWPMAAVGAENGFELAARQWGQWKPDSTGSEIVLYTVEEEAPAEEWKLVDSVEDGGSYIIVADDQYALSGVPGEAGTTSAPVTIEGDKVVGEVPASLIWTFESADAAGSDGSDLYHITDAAGNYLRRTSRTNLVQVENADPSNANYFAWSLIEREDGSSTFYQNGSSRYAVTIAESGTSAARVSSSSGNILASGSPVKLYTNGKICEHEWTEVVTAPTCTEGGYTTKTCAKCGKVKITDKVPALGHTPDPETANTVAPTCTERGYTEYVCSVCGETYQTDFVNATGHSWGEWTRVTDPTCTEAGTEQRVCSVCEEVGTRSIAALGHDWTDGDILTEPTEEEFGVQELVCSRCGEKSSKYLLPTKYTAGPKLVADPESPTGYTGQFTYYDPDAEVVYFCGDLMLSDMNESGGSAATYSPFEYRPGLMRRGGSQFKEEMTPIGNGWWYYEVPLAAGANQYWFNTNTITRMIPDPNNHPQWSPASNWNTKDAYNAIYVPYDEKQDNPVLEARAKNENPRTDEKVGTWSYVPYELPGQSNCYMGVYLPYGYDAERARPYRTIYVLHGGGQDESDWLGIGSVQNIIDNLYANGDIDDPYVLIVPRNSRLGTGNLEATFAFVEANYNVSADRMDRAICGLSMGGMMINNLLRDDASRDEPSFGYYGLFSGGQPSNALSSPHLLKSYYYVGNGLYEGNIYNQSLVDSGAFCVFKQFAGAHDFNTWCQMFTDFARSYAFRPYAFGDISMEDIDFTDPADADRYAIENHASTEIRAGGLYLVATADYFDPIGASETPAKDVVQVPVTGDWTATLTFNFSGRWGSNSYLGVYAMDDYDNFAGVRASSNNMQDIIRKDGEVTANTMAKTPGLTSSSLHAIRIVKEGDKYTCYWSNNDFDFVELFSFEDTGIEAKTIAIDAYSASAGGWFGSFSYLLKSLSYAAPCVHESDPSVLVDASKPATCTEAGVNALSCPICGKSKSETVAALGHTKEGASYDVIAPTCTEGGYTEYVCPRCGEKFQDERTAALGHDWTDGDIITAPTETEFGEQEIICARCGEHSTKSLLPTSLKEGPTVVKDPESPTGYTVKFVYKNPDVASVEFYGDIALRDDILREEDPNTVYTPFEYRPGLMRAGSWHAPMESLGGGYWYIEVPLAAGANQYWFRIPGSSRMLPDPANHPEWSPNSNENSKNAYNIVYVPYDPVQDYEPMKAREAELPRTDGKSGEWWYQPMEIGGRTHYMAIYTPPGYTDPRGTRAAGKDEPYKLIFTLHGSGQDESDWFGIGSVQKIMDNLVAEGRTEPAVIVSPTTNNSMINGNNFSNLMDIIIPYLEENFYISSDPMDRAFCGLSAGGGTTQSIINGGADRFGYYGPWSAGCSINASAPGLEKAHILLGTGWSDTTIRPNHTAHLPLVEAGYFVKYEVVTGGHDFNAWNQLFRIFCEDYLWKPWAFGDGEAPNPEPTTLEDIDFTDPEDADRYSIENQESAEIRDQGLYLVATPAYFDPIGNSEDPAADVVKIPAEGDWTATLNFTFNGRWGSNSYLGFYAYDDDDNFVGIRASSNNMQDIIAKDGEVTANTMSKTPGLTSSTKHSLRIVKQGDDYTCYWSNNNFDFVELFSFTDSEIKGDTIVIDAYSASAGGWFGSFSYYLDSLSFKPICEHESDPSLINEAITKEATCTEAGSKTTFCMRCGAFKTETIPALGHTKEGAEANVVAPTCTAQGYTEYVCPVCGETFVDDRVPATGHTKEGAEYVVTEPTCLEGGYTTYTCPVCGEEFVDDRTPALGHDWVDGDVIVEPGQDTFGKQEQKCSRCDATQEIILLPLEYKLGPTLVKDPESPTGYTAYFIYQNGDCQQAYFCGDIALKNDADLTDTKTYEPEEYKPGLMRSASITRRPMQKVGDDLWVTSVPLAAGANQYWFNLDNNTSYMVPDPANHPQWSPNSNWDTKNAYNALYVPYDPVQDYEPTKARTVENPRDDEKVGTWWYEPVEIDGRTHYMGVYLPYGYDAERAEPYKTIWILHGGGQDESDWMGIGSVQEILDNLIAEGRTEPAVLISPTTNNNMMGGTGDAYANLFNVLIPYVEEKFNVSTDKMDRAIGGLSMGSMNTQNIINADTEAEKFGYYGPWSGGVSVQTTAKGIEYAHILFAGGTNDFGWGGASAEAQVARMAEQGIFAKAMTVTGAHDFNTWCQMFRIWCEDYLWQPWAFGDFTMEDIDFTDPADADRYIVKYKDSAEIREGGLYLVATPDYFDPIGANQGNPKDVVQVPVKGDWTATLTFNFSGFWGSNSYLGVYAMDDYDNFAGVRASSNNMQDIIRKDGEVTANTMAKTPGLTSSSLHAIRIVKEGDKYTCYWSNNDFDFTELFSFEDTGIDAKVIAIDAYSAAAGGWFGSFSYLLKEMCFHEPCVHETDPSVLVDASRPATCTEAGVDAVSCPICGKSKSQTIAALGHIKDAETARVTEPTCTEAGYTTYTCPRCGEDFQDERKAALGHDWTDGDILVAPTEDEFGVQELICARCGEKSSKYLLPTKYTAGPKLVADPESPTGYTGQFTYYDPDAEVVYFCGDLMLSDMNESGGSAATYSPFEYRPGLMRRGGSQFKEPMTAIGNGWWYYEVPLSAGANQYWFNTNTITRMIPDPYNHPQWSPASNWNTKDAYNAIYVPYDEKQDNPVLEGRAKYENPRDDEKVGTWSYVPYELSGQSNCYMGVYLPYGYDAEREQPYKTIYVLHGGGQDESDWLGIGSVQNIIDNLYANGDIDDPYVLIVPRNSRLGTGNLEATFAFVEANYNVSADRMDRAICGLSMGGMMINNLLNDDKNREEASFGYYGLFSGGQPSNALNSPHLLESYYYVGNGLYEGNIYNQSLVDSGAYYHFAQFAGAHDFNTWCQMFTDFAGSYAFHPENFQKKVEFTPGPVVVADPESPTGYTGKFTYYDPDAEMVYFCGDLMLSDINEPGRNAAVYSPFEYRPGLMRRGGSQFKEEMTPIGDGWWYYELPLSAGANQYWFNTDTTTRMLPDPYNHPQWSPASNWDTKNAYNAVYVPYDEKQDNEVLRDRAAHENPRDDEKVGTWSYVEYDLPSRTGNYMGVYLPYGYDAEREQPYRTIYVLHGGGQDESDWLGIGSVQNIIDNLYANGEINDAPVLIVPNASRLGAGNLEATFAFVEENYNVSTDRMDRAICGLSMGGMMINSLLRDDASRDEASFGYYGLFSGGQPSNALTSPHLYESYYYVGNGMYEGNIYNESLVNSGAYYHFAQFAGAHDFNSWCQLFTDFARSYAFHPENFDAVIGNGYKPGPLVVADPESPTGYTGKFTYYDPDAEMVYFCGDLMLSDINESGRSAAVYSPFEYRPGLMRRGGSQFKEEMTPIGDGWWYYELPLSAGANQYWFNTDTTTRMLPDPYNHPQWSPASNWDTKNAYNAVYVPYDEKQDNPVLESRAKYENPRTDRRKGTWSYVQYDLPTQEGCYMGVYLPYGYNANREQPYKTIYVLHGGGQDESDWLGIGSVQNIIDNLYANGDIEDPYVLIVPRASRLGAGNLEATFAFVEENYNVSTDRMDRAICGLSMGGMMINSLLRDDASRDEASFGYYGLFSGGQPSNALNSPHLYDGYYYVGSGLYEGSPYNQALVDSCACYHFAQFAGAHDFNTWCQMFTDFAKNYAFHPENFEAPTAQQILAKLQQALADAKAAQAAAQAAQAAAEAAQAAAAEDKAAAEAALAAAQEAQQAAEAAQAAAEAAQAAADAANAEAAAKAAQAAADAAKAAEDAAAAAQALASAQAAQAAAEAAQAAAEAAQAEAAADKAAAEAAKAAAEEAKAAAEAAKQAAEAANAEAAEKAAQAAADAAKAAQALADAQAAQAAAEAAQAAAEAAQAAAEAAQAQVNADKEAVEAAKAAAEAAKAEAEAAKAAAEAAKAAAEQAKTDAEAAKAEAAAEAAKAAAARAAAEAALADAQAAAAQAAADKAAAEAAKQAAEAALAAAQAAQAAAEAAQAETAADKAAAEAAKAKAEAAQAAAERAKAAAEEAQAAAEAANAQAAAQAAKAAQDAAKAAQDAAKAAQAQAAAQAAQAAAEAAKAVAEVAAASAATDKAAAEAAKAAAEAAQRAAELAKQLAEDADADAAKQAADAAKSAAAAARAQAAAQAAEEAAEAAAASAALDKQAAEEARVAAEAAKQAAQAAQAAAEVADADAAEKAAAAAASAADAARAQAAAQNAQALAEAAQAAADAARAKAEEAAARGEIAAGEAEAAKAAADQAAKAAEAAKQAAAISAAAAESSNVAAAEAAAASAANAAQTAKDLQEIAAMKAAVAADREAVELERQKAEAAKLGAAKYYALTQLALAASKTRTDHMKPEQLADFEKIVAAATKAIEDAADEAAVDAALAAGIEAVSKVPEDTCPSRMFVDAPAQDNWAHAGIDYCVANGLMKGISETVFDPTGDVTRAQLVTILYRLAGEPAAEYKGTFSDVADGLWYTKAIEWAADNGVVNGVGNGKFAPDTAITREQIAAILYRYSGSPKTEGSLSAFPDSASVSPYAVDAMIWATSTGLINGIGQGDKTILSPQTKASRAQIASIIMRYAES